MSDSVVLRRVYALNATTNLFLPPNQTLLTDGLGGTTWTDFYGSSSGLVGYLPSTISSLSTSIYINVQYFGGLSSLSSDMYSAVSSLGESIDSNLPGFVNAGKLVSTVEGLGSSGYISSTQLFSTLANLGTTGYISSQTLSQTLSTLGTTYGYVSSISLYSTVGGLGGVGYISTSQLRSTVAGLGTIGYLSTGQFEGLVRSTVEGLGTVGYVSSTQLTSSVTGITSHFQSTVVGLGSIGYVSSTQLVSTVRGLGSIGYISTTQLASSITGLATIGYISTSQLRSTVAGLGSIGYMSSGQIESQLRSTVAGLGTIGYISTTQLFSTVIGLQDYTPGLSVLPFTSTVAGLAESGYVCTLQLFSTSEGVSLARANMRFDTTDSVSIIGGSNSIAFGNVISTSITGGTNTIVYLTRAAISSFYISSIGYNGPTTGTQINGWINNPPQPVASNGSIPYVSTGRIHDMSFSTASINFAPFSNYIDRSSIVTLDIYPTFLFSKLATGASNVTVIPISTSVQYGVGSGSILNSDICVTSFAYLTNTQVIANRTDIYGNPIPTDQWTFLDSSNAYTTPIRMTFPKEFFVDSGGSYFTSNYTLVHQLPSSLNNGAYQNALHNNTITPYFTQNDSLFVSIQNLQDS